MLQNFEKIFKKANNEQRKDLFHSLIKEITIQNSENIWERKASEIILNFNEQDIIKYTESKENNGEKGVNIL